MFKKAEKSQAYLRLALFGGPGVGKTYSMLAIAEHLGQRIAVIDTERGSSAKYADRFSFDLSEPESFAPAEYVKIIREAETAGYDVLCIDSLSHAWFGKGGELEMVHRAEQASASKNSYYAWREVTPHHNALIEAILRYRGHVIVTMRSKVEYQVVDKKPTKIGLAPIMREGVEYEFDVVGQFTETATLVINKTRCEALTDAVFTRPSADLAKILKDWLTTGVAIDTSPFISHSDLWQKRRQRYEEKLAEVALHNEACENARLPDFRVAPVPFDVNWNEETIVTHGRDLVAILEKQRTALELGVIGAIGRSDRAGVV